LTGIYDGYRGECNKTNWQLIVKDVQHRLSNANLYMQDLPYNKLRILCIGGERRRAKGRYKEDMNDK